MSRYLIITSGLNGILNASYKLASKIIDDGHECIISSPADIEHLVQAQGFPYFRFDSINYDPAPEIPSFTGTFRKIKRMIYKINHSKIRQQEGIDSLKTDLFLSKVKSIDPEKILIDIELHEFIMTLYVHQFDFTLLSQWFSTWKRVGLPPIVTDIIPGKGIQGSALGMWIAWKRIQIVRWWIFLKKRVLSCGSDRRSILLAYADQIGFPKELIRENYWPGPISYDQLLVWCMTDKEMEFPHEIRPNLKYIGKMVLENRKEAAVSQEVKEEINLILNEKDEGKKKLIYCSVSTFSSGDQQFLLKVIEAVKNQSHWILIIGLGGKIGGFKETSLPKNIHVFPYAPQLQILKKADLSINHGGIHTINECLHFDVPMLVYSGKRSDQNGCAARVQYYGKGLMGDKDRDTAADVYFKVNRILSNYNF